MKQRLKATPASYLILKKENEILMHLRKNSGYMDGYYGFVAGHIEPLEGPVECIIREAKEEAGVKILKEDLKFVHTTYRPLAKGERVDFFYLCEKWSGDIINCEPEKCGELNFFNINGLPHNTIPHLKHVLEYVLNKPSPFSEYLVEDPDVVS